MALSFYLSPFILSFFWTQVLYQGQGMLRAVFGLADKPSFSFFTFLIHAYMEVFNRLHFGSSDTGDRRLFFFFFALLYMLYGLAELGLFSHS